MLNRLPQDIVQKLKGSMQNLKYHPEGSVYNHISQVYQNALDFYPGNMNVAVSAIFHDLGKIDCVQVKDVVNDDGTITQKISNIGHELKSLDYIPVYKHLFDDADVDWDCVFYIVKNHMKTHLYLDGTMKNPHKRKTFHDSPYFDDIVKFGHCDKFNTLLK